ncbi:hypothetical protein QC763_602403 [Podospora pseudopauciseta]|uniref:Ankyrin repeat protein n=2 Tax=Podospora TaxID=5144 RepID=A0ABR0H4P4_9PEZI|nr:hypothetical protein QC763_602403 [Podospora pseudopauciseta]KAK4671200.1 hypothetical protein QC764_602403 [Podospora pseudoanserina]
MQSEIMSHDGAIPLLHCAVGRGHIETVNKLLRAGADIDARAGNGETALHIAAQFGRMTITAMLLASGAKIKAKDNEGHTPRHLAQEKGPSNFECLFDLAWPREIQSREKIPVIPDITPESHSTKSPYSFTKAFRKFHRQLYKGFPNSKNNWFC